MSAVFLLNESWGRRRWNKGGEEWCPTRPRRAVATLPGNHTHIPPSRSRTMRHTSCGPCLLCKDAPWLLGGLFTSLWSQSAAVAWHCISPRLLKGLRIYCNAIVLDRIGPVMTLMMASSSNLDSSLLHWRPHVGMVTYGRGSWANARESFSDLGLASWLEHNWLLWTCHIKCGHMWLLETSSEAAPGWVQELHHKQTHGRHGGEEGFNYSETTTKKKPRSSVQKLYLKLKNTQGCKPGNVCRCLYPHSPVCNMLKPYISERVCGAGMVLISFTLLSGQSPPQTLRAVVCICNTIP